MAMSTLASRSNWTFIISVLTLITTCVFYVKNIQLTSQMYSASTFSDLHREYSDPNMLDALDAVHKFMSEHEAPEEAMRSLAALKSTDPSRAKELDHARRRVQQWYSKLMLFHEFGLVDMTFLSRFPGEQRARRFIRTFEPLAVATRAATDRELNDVYGDVRRVFGIHDVPVPSPVAVRPFSVEHVPEAGQQRDEL